MSKLEARRSTHTGQFGEEIISGLALGAVPSRLGLDVVRGLAHEKCGEKVDLLRVLVQRGQLRAKNHKGVPGVSLLEELQKLLLPYSELHNVRISTLDQKQASSGRILTMFFIDGAKQKVLCFVPRAFCYGGAEGGDCGRLQLISAVLADSLCGGVVAQVGQSLDQDAGDLLSIVAEVWCGGDGGVGLLLSVYTG